MILGYFNKYNGMTKEELFKLASDKQRQIDDLNDDIREIRETVREINEEERYERIMKSVENIFQTLTKEARCKKSVVQSVLDDIIELAMAKEGAR